MMLCQLSVGYCAAAVPLRARLKCLRCALKQCGSAAERSVLRYKIAQLSAILTQCRDLEALTAHYYERSFYRDEKYTL